MQKGAHSVCNLSVRVKTFSSLENFLEPEIKTFWIRENFLEPGCQNFLEPGVNFFFHKTRYDKLMMGDKSHACKLWFWLLYSLLALLICELVPILSDLSFL